LIVQSSRVVPLLVAFVMPFVCWAGGSGLNVLVVANQNSTNSLELANYYCEKRGIPPNNVLRVNWTGGNTTWSLADYTNVLLNPVLDAVHLRGLTNQIDYLVLSMDLPFQVTEDGNSSAAGINSSTSPLFYGFKADEPAPPQPGVPNSCFLPYASSNSYSGSEMAFELARPGTAPTNSFLTTMLTASSLAQAKYLVDAGRASDSTFPAQPVLLAHGGDPFRNVRYATFDDAIFNTRLRPGYLLYETNLDSPSWFANLLGFQTGLQNFGINSNTFVPGAIADSLTSYGGLIFGPNDQTSLIAFIDAGATASYGTVVEPCNYLEKFPSPQTYFYQARGFSVAESYYQSVTNPYQGLIVGEPLAAPFARPGSVLWSNLAPQAVLSGTTNLLLHVNSPDPHLPVGQVDLFVDGLLFQTITNFPPETGNLLWISVNGVATNYMVSAGATLTSIASTLTSRLNDSSFSNAAGIRAFNHGDRVELKSSVPGRLGAQTSLLVSNSAGTAPSLGTFADSSGTNFLESPARGRRSFYLTNAPAMGDYLECTVIKTNGQTVVVNVTNTSTGTTLAQFAKAFFSAINTNSALQSADGIAIEDIVMHEDYTFAFGSNDHAGDYNVRARTTGWQASQVQVCITGSSTFGFQPAATNALDDNVEDLQPRADVLVTAGLTNCVVPFTLDTTLLADGYHEFTAVAYEGSHVRTQARATEFVQLQNTGLHATLSTLYGGSNTAVTATLQFAVSANTNTSKIELFSTGGVAASSIGQSNSLFSIAGATLGAGLHPFYAVVTSTAGQMYRTPATWIRLVGHEPHFTVSITAPPPSLTWPATAGRSYDVLSTTNLMLPFELRATVMPSSSLGQWVDANFTGQSFYQIRSD
jgi:uncharacterized protein (TIGR03790 family)